MTDGSGVPPISDQQRFWNEWNAAHREGAKYDAVAADPESRRRAEVVLEWLGRLRLERPSILDVGCGSGWLSERLAGFGVVTAVDLADEVIARARARLPHITFHAGDFAQLPLPPASFDVVVCLETLSALPHQAPFVEHLARVTRPGGYLLLTVHNRFVYERRDDVQPLAPGQVRRWMTRAEVKDLLKPHYRLMRFRTVMPAGHRGVLRIVNSYKINALLGLVLSERRIALAKERLGFGTTMVVLARRRS